MLLGAECTPVSGNGHGRANVGVNCNTHADPNNSTGISGYHQVNNCTFRRCTIRPPNARRTLRPSPKFTRRFGINLNHTLAETFPFTDDTPCEMNRQTLRQRARRHDRQTVVRHHQIFKAHRAAVGTRTPTGQPVVGESTFFLSRRASATRWMRSVRPCVSGRCGPLRGSSSEGKSWRRIRARSGPK